MRSLFAGVSGLKVHQTRMDSIGNNIANINTVGFKSSRTTFADMLSQTQAGAAAPSQTVGGTNPKQIGLGVAVASIDLIFTDGSPQGTGKNTDLALSGNGLFVVKNGDSTFYTRDGAFSFDEQGYYVLPGSGLKVQGWNAVDGSLNTNSNPTDIIVPTGKTMEAAATTEVTFSGNLNATSPLITAIGEDTVDGHFHNTEEDGALNLTLSNDSSLSVSTGSYTIGHSVPMSTILQVYDSQGMAHSVPIQLEKVAANQWEASLSNIFGKHSDAVGGEDEGGSDEEGVTAYTYIRESDGTYTRVSILSKTTGEEESTDEEEGGDGFSVANSFTVNFDKDGNAIGDLTARIRLEYNFEPIIEETEGEDGTTIQTITGYQRIGGEESEDGGDSEDENAGVRMNGARDTTASVNFKGLTQYAGSNSAYPSADGNVAGTLVSISVDTSGVITGTYTNGMNQFEAQVAVAQFTNAAGLTKSGNSIYAESNNSGTANIKTAPDLGLTITPSALEMSNVDLANEFSEMIITQRGFQANSKIINVGDEMLETLVNMKR